MAKNIAEWLLLSYVPFLALVKGILYYIHCIR
ncbi:hypothetical protein SAMN06264849_108189 [Melghirimyces algeriensis]|uniref:Uncharacterized protein n=1 Tax=Melghirimyces algeriensis TaxID=910412 RepID=A0A521ED89_9BACL|nr:hypothetical protein SAMN06264849_108189 [Melghirimyces algeriensis]